MTHSNRAKNKNRSQRQRSDPIKAANHEVKRGMVSVCPRKFQRLLTSKNLDITSFSTIAEVSRNTAYKLLNEKPIKRSTLDDLCEKLKIDPASLLVVSDDGEREGKSLLVPPRGWEIAEYYGSWQRAPNGLSYRIVRLKSTLVSGRFARGKFYDLVHLSATHIPKIKEHLTRHASVCHKIGSHSQIIEHLDIRQFDEDNGWWVLDRWIDGQSLESLVEETIDVSSIVTSPYNIVRQLGADILCGLSALHEASIVFRELSPDKVWVSTKDGHAVLTDFELAKLIGGAPSVSGLWQPGYFRAPEVSDYEAYPESDLYSWARILVWFLACGRAKKDTIAPDVPLSKAIREVISRCLKPRHTERPRSAEAVLKIWNSWK